jgi:hypothetical protein
MANPIIYDGTPGLISGSTPFGFYDLDPVYQADGPKVANYVARKLGYPVLDVELDDINIYACFEEAVSIYAEEVYQSKIKDNYLTLEGSPTGSTLNNTVVSPNLTNVINLSETYGAMAGIGGFVDWRTGSIELYPHQQTYDLQEWAISSQNMSSTDRVVIQRIMYQTATPDYIYGFGTYYPQLAGAGANPSDWGGAGFGSYLGGANSVVIYPLYWDLQRIQEIEMSNMIRRPNQSFELINNKLRIFPIPTSDGHKLWIHYAFQSDMMSLTGNSPYGSNQGLVANPALAPYTLITYQQINQPGKQWIYEYTLALASELLGLVRGKYTTVPIPGAETTLNGADLVAKGREMQEKLREKLKTDLEDMTRRAQLERKQAENQSLNDTLNNIPLMVYVG